MPKSKYTTHVKPRFDEIEKWISKGATEKEVACNLGISHQSLITYKDKHIELLELIKKARIKPVMDIKAALYRRAIGFQYTEVREVEDHLGRWKTERFTKTALPDPASAMILLKHWDKDGEWTQDPQMLKIKKEELDLKREKMEADNW